MEAEKITGLGWAVLSVTEYYGPAAEYGLIGTYSVESEADEEADEHNPDYDPAVGGCRLEHNQSGRTYGEVREIIAVHDANHRTGLRVRGLYIYDREMQRVLQLSL